MAGNIYDFVTSWLKANSDKSSCSNSKMKVRKLSATDVSARDRMGPGVRLKLSLGATLAARDFAAGIGMAAGRQSQFDLRVGISVAQPSFRLSSWCFRRQAVEFIRGNIHGLS
jgi:hypothetical protein